MFTIEVPQPLARFRRYAMDGALLLFDRDSGLSALCDGPETAHLRRTVPRVIQLGLTNLCNLACGFCSRDRDAESQWTVDSLMDFLSDLSEAGVLEVAFGGGEPLAFAAISTLLQRIHAETNLAASVTTNGLLLKKTWLREVRGLYGQIRVSLYDDVPWQPRLEILAQQQARFGVNLLVTPERLGRLVQLLADIESTGCRDILLLAYNGHDVNLHLNRAEHHVLAQTIRILSSAMPHVTFKLDVCWGESLAAVPKLFPTSDCGAGQDFVVVTSDKKLLACSFHHDAITITNARDLLDVYRSTQARLQAPSLLPGCARLPDRGLGAQSRRNVPLPMLLARRT